MSKYLRVGSAIKAGLIATLTMTLFMYAGPLVGLPRMDVMGSLGNLIPGNASPYPAGALLHFGFGATLALIYAALFARLLPGPGWARGALFSLLPWIIAIVALPTALAYVQSLINPATAAAALNPCAVANPCAAVTNPCAANVTSAGSGQAAMALLSLANHLVYGVILGALYRWRD